MQLVGTDSYGRHISERFVEVAGLTGEEIKTRSLSALIASSRNGDQQETIENLLLCLDTHKPFRDILLPVMVRNESRWWLLSGKPMVVRGHFAGYRGVGSDVTDKKQAEDRLSYLVTHDALTDLPNRFLFQQKFDRALARLERGEGFAVLCLDLDEFKGVNDTLGHGAGDNVLRLVSERMKRELPEGAFLARIAGDEFVILLGGRSLSEAGQAGAGQNRKNVWELCDRIIAAINEPCQIGDGVISVGVSIGAAFAPDDGSHEIMRRADLALYQAKRAGRNSYHFYIAEMDEELNARRELAADLKNAMERREFILYYQPVVNAATCKIMGFEALLRWRHPTRGFVPPSEFIPLAEDSGLIMPLGKWIIEEACREAAAWAAPVKIAINISSVQLRYSNLPNIVARALQASGLPAARLDLELTESVFLEATASTQKALRDLHAMGVHLSLDDFGTGYSSLSYLRRFTFNKIKIDQSFVRNLPEDLRDVSIVRAIVDIATTMGVATIAEGVETEEQRICLLQQGCHQLQGYLFSKPVPSEEAAAMLTEGRYECVRSVAA